ncbi:unnamed protein product [Soboliphyme baturini]|uniref:NUC153 domain-containing protein n=1 Tax=Soboliphyme baturini TaxID=241478 RepID=A0A183J9Y0_9BILA|nr:unnamed protein product [Soboliphyme baturini]
MEKSQYIRLKEKKHWKGGAAKTSLRRIEPDLEQTLDDQRIAAMLQNEEFMQRLRADADFMSALERDMAKKKHKSEKRAAAKNAYLKPPTDPVSSVIDEGPPLDASPFPYTKQLESTSPTTDFRDKLKYMGKSK